uniref:Uncharacterized protein n=1 Tax=Anolis carolinensis TaxID=28377 RepID=A0A803SYX9_ANOCA
TSQQSIPITKVWQILYHVGSFFHVWWSCEETQKFWKAIHSGVQKILKKTFPLKPEYYLLGITDNDIYFSRNEDILFTYMNTAARIIFAKHWKTQNIPNTEECPCLVNWMKYMIWTH